MASLADWQLRPGWLGHRLAESTAPFILPTICLLPLVLTVAFMTEPFERDEGTYATIAQGLVRGELPYRDLFDHKPPLIYVWYALSFTVFGETIVAPRLMAALVWSLTAIVVYKQGTILLSEAAGRAAALIFALSSAIVLLQANANTEAFMILPLAGSLYSFTQGLKTQRLEWFALAGLCGGLAVLTKQVAGVNLAAGALFIAAYTARDVGARQVIRQFAALFAVFVLVIGVALVPYVVSGSVGDFFYANWTYNRLYAAEISPVERIDAQVTGDRFFLTVAAPLVLLALVGFLSVLRDKAGGGLLVVGWLAASYGGLLLSGRAFPHYYVGLLPPLAILAGIGLASWRVPSRSTRVFKSIFALGAFLCLLFNVSVFLQSTPQEKHTARFGHETGVQLSFNLASNSYTAIDLAKHNDSPRLAAYIRSITSKSDTIYNFGRETQLYFYADRRPATRFIYDRPFWLDPSTFEQAMDDLRTNKPVLIIDSVTARSDPNWNATHPAALQTMLESDYRFVARFEFADIYRLKGR